VRLLRSATILVEGERIAAIGGVQEVSVPPAAQVIDVGGAWLIPGLMNMHVHLAWCCPASWRQSWHMKRKAN
jgi:imidazolonepropionase-like amidohydrolase